MDEIDKNDYNMKVVLLLGCLFLVLSSIGCLIISLIYIYDLGMYDMRNDPISQATGSPPPVEWEYVFVGFIILFTILGILISMFILIVLSKYLYIIFLPLITFVISIVEGAVYWGSYERFVFHSSIVSIMFFLVFIYVNRSRIIPRYRSPSESLVG